MSSKTYRIIYIVLGAWGFATYVLNDPPRWFVGWFMFMLGVVGYGLELANEKLNRKKR